MTVLSWVQISTAGRHFLRYEAVSGWGGVTDPLGSDTVGDMQTKPVVPKNQLPKLPLQSPLHHFSGSSAVSRRITARAAG